MGLEEAEAEGEEDFLFSFAKFAKTFPRWPNLQFAICQLPAAQLVVLSKTFLAPKIILSPETRRVNESARLRGQVKAGSYQGRIWHLDSIRIASWTSDTESFLPESPTLDLVADIRLAKGTLLPEVSAQKDFWSVVTTLASLG